MSLDLVQETWNELKRFMSDVDKSDAADSLVHLLIDHDYDADDIKTAFKSDSDIKSALKGYLAELEAENDTDDDDDDYDDDYDDDDDY